MPAPSPLAPFLEPLERLGLPYCITGSVAASVYLRKLEYLREGGQDKHIRDIHFMLAVTVVDQGFLEAEVARLGLHEQWRKCLEQA